eukprot:PhF_6_TR40380/c1_g7_i2/m.60138
MCKACLRRAFRNTSESGEFPRGRHVIRWEWCVDPCRCPGGVGDYDSERLRFRGCGVASVSDVILPSATRQRLLLRQGYNLYGVDTLSGNNKGRIMLLPTQPKDQTTRTNDKEEDDINGMNGAVYSSAVAIPIHGCGPYEIGERIGGVALVQCSWGETL